MKNLTRQMYKQLQSSLSLPCTYVVDTYMYQAARDLCRNADFQGMRLVKTLSQLTPLVASLFQTFLNSL